MKFATFFWELIAYTCISTSCSLLTERDRLTEDLFRSYNRHNKPTIKPLKKLTVGVGFMLHDLASIRIDEKAQNMETSGEIILYWQDELLKWNPNDYGGIRMLSLSNTQIWFPRLKLMNSVEQVNDVGVDAEIQLLLDSNGTVMWWPDFKWKTVCDINIIYFPFDTQICNVTFWNPVQFVDGVVLQSTGPEMLFQFANTVTPENNAWGLVNSSVHGDTLHELDMNGDGEIDILSRIWFTLVLKRKPAYLVMNVLVPSVLISVMSLLVFLLPCESGEKIGLSITVFLGYSVVLLMISDMVPQTGDKLPLLSKFIVASMVITGISLCMTIFILNIHHHSPESSVPKWAKTIFLQKLATLLCMKTKTISIEPQKIEEEKTGVEKLCCNANALPDELMDFIKKRMKDAEADEIICCNKEQWEGLARVIDRLFLIINFLVILITMSYFLMDIIN